MDNRDTIRRRVIDRAVALFDADNPNGGGLFTTAHYGQAMKAEFRTAGPTLDGATCSGHLSKMGDLVKRAGGNMWRRLDGAQHTRDIGHAEPAGPAAGEVEDAFEAAEEVVVNAMVVLLRQDGIGWWYAEMMTEAMEDRLLEVPVIRAAAQAGGEEFVGNLVNCVLYTMAVEGRVATKRNMLVDGAPRTVFALVPKGADIDGAGGAT